MSHGSIRIFVVTMLLSLSYALGVPTVIAGSGASASASSVAACSGNDFWGGWVGQNGAAGTIIYNIAFINDGRTSCRLAGIPTVQGYKNGREYPLNAGHVKGQA